MHSFIAFIALFARLEYITLFSIVQDMYLDNGEFYLDQKQDYQILFGSENETHTTLRFQRKFDTCDSKDWKITNDTVRVMYIYQDDDPINKTIVFQSNSKKGKQSLYLLEEPQEHLHMTSSISVWDIRLPNIGLSGSGTIYHCKIFKAPKTSTKHQVIGFKALTDGRKRVHHMILYECHVGTSNSEYKTYINDGGHECYSSNMPKAYTHCSTILIAWGVGSEGDVMPLNVGFPLGEEFGGATYFMLEVHYELMLEQKQSVIDNYGLRLFLTNKIRLHDASVINIGHVVSPLQIIPPGEKSYVSVAHCGSTCTRNLLPSTGINIFGLTLLAHSLATGITLRHIREGVELPPLIDEKNYDSTYLQSHRLKHHGDHLMVECNYDTFSRNNSVVGGLSMRNEVCLAMVQYYPRSSLSECQSWPAIDLLTSWFNIKLEHQENGFVVEDFNQLDGSRRTLTDYLKRYRWAGRSHAYQRDIRFGQYLPFCLRHGRFPANLSLTPANYPEITYPHYVVSAVCSVNTTQETMVSYTKVMDAKSNKKATMAATTITPMMPTAATTTTAITLPLMLTDAAVMTSTEAKLTGDWLDGVPDAPKLTSPTPPAHLNPRINIIQPSNQANCPLNTILILVFPANREGIREEIIIRIGSRIWMTSFLGFAGTLGDHHKFIIAGQVICLVQLITLVMYCTFSHACGPVQLVRQTPQMTQYMGISSGFCPTTVIGNCRQCMDNYQCPGNQICCPVSGLYCCVAAPKLLQINRRVHVLQHCIEIS
uniref:DOMON domain-containing protein n=1 Tax=Strigamia maritima TaxID=126957 RepID=T1IY35_STRMM